MINIKNKKLDIIYYPEDGVVSFDIGTLKQFSPKSWPFNCYYEILLLRSYNISWYKSMYLLFVKLK